MQVILDLQWIWERWIKELKKEHIFLDKKMIWFTKLAKYFAWELLNKKEIPISEFMKLSYKNFWVDIYEIMKTSDILWEVCLLKTQYKMFFERLYESQIDAMH